MAQSIGEQLKQARSKRGLTLEQVSQATHIRKHYLEALENDQRDALPSPVQGRGFLRLYAGHLDLPIQQLLDIWDGKAPEEPTPHSSTADPADSLAESAAGAAEAADAAEAAVAAKAADAALAASADEGVKAPKAKKARSAQARVETAKTASAPAPVKPAEPQPNQASEPLPAAPAPVNAAEEENTPGAPLGSQAIFREIGEKLCKQRENLGLSRAEVERFTRLRQHYIQALEEGQIEALPSPVQGRGMLSNYVAFLNMDEDAILLRFAEGLQARRIERIPKPEPGQQITKKRPARQAPFWRRFLTPDLIFGIGVAVVILFFVLWTAARITNLRTTSAGPTPPDISEVLLTPKASASGTLGAVPSPGATIVAGETTGTAGPGAQTAAPGDAGTGEPLDPTVVEGTAVVASTTETAAAALAATGVVGGGQAQASGSGSSQNTFVTLTPVPTLISAPPSNGDPLQVYIVARQRAWLRVDADNKLKFLGRTVPGNAYAFSGTKKIEMLTGNAAALQVFYNQNDLGTLGRTGQVVGLVFTGDGMMTPTPAFTPTGTPTKLATYTPLPSATLQATPTITPYVPK